MTSRHIIDLIIKFQNKEIDKQKFDSNIFLDTAFNYFYFNKEAKKTIKIKEGQNKVFQSFFKKESAQEASEKILKMKVRQKKETPENAEAVIKEQRKELITNLLKHKDISLYAEHSYNSYIPPKNMSLSLKFHLSNYKEYKKYLSESNAQMCYKNPSLANPKKDKITNKYSEPPFIIDEKNDILLVSKNEENNDFIENIQKENQKELNNIINDEEDDILFYSEKLIKEDDIKKSSKWLNDMTPEEINSNFANLVEVRKDNKVFDNNNYFTFDSNFSITELDPLSIFDDIPLGGDIYKKYTQYLTDKSYKNYIKKLNYYYLDLMLLQFFDLDLEFKKYNFLEKEVIALNFIKKLILASGVCINKIYEHIIRAIIGKKGNFNLENFLECFSPIFEASEKFQTFKYRFLLFLAKGPKSQNISMDNYKVFCNLIKGKIVYEEDTCKKLSKNMLDIFKKKYPYKQYADNFKYFQISTIVDYIVDKEYNEF